MKLRLETPFSALILALVLAWVGFTPEASAAPRCELAFSGDERGGLRGGVAALSTTSRSAELKTELDSLIELTNSVVSIDVIGNKDIRPGSLPLIQKTAQVALAFVRELGIEAKLVTFDELPAIEFTPIAKSSSGWNRMAAALQKNYGVRLIYSPQYLNLHVMKSGWNRENRTVLVSRESLRVGRAERNNLQEFGHMKSDLTREQSPNVFSGFFASLQANQTLVPNAAYYRRSETELDEIELDEVTRLAQDIFHLGLDIQRAETKETQTKLRSELKEVATRGIDILDIAKANVKFIRSVEARMSEDGFGSGPLLLEDGSIDPYQAYVATANGVQISIDEQSNGTLKFTLQDDDLASTLWVPASAAWHKLLPRLQVNDLEAHAEFKRRFKTLVKEWEKGITPSLRALQSATKVILGGAETLSREELARVAKAPRSVVAPHLVRRANRPAKP